MIQDNRQEPRYIEIGHVTALDICPITGILDDISNTGCKIHYPFPITVDLDNEYDIKVSPLHFSDQSPLHLVCQPRWVNEVEGKTYIGFKVLYSPDGAKLVNFVDYLEQLEQNQLPDIG